MITWSGFIEKDKGRVHDHLIRNVGSLPFASWYTPTKGTPYDGVLRFVQSKLVNELIDATEFFFYRNRLRQLQQRSDGQGLFDRQVGEKYVILQHVRNAPLEVGI